MTNRAGSGTSHLLPTGTVTFLLTDVVGSTELWEQAPEQMAKAMHRHDHLIVEAAEAHRGAMPVAQGEGDSALVAFERSTDAVACAIAIQKAIGESEDAYQIRLRIGLHTGEAQLRDRNYFGSALNRSARLRSLAHGGQIVISQATFDLVRDQLPSGSSTKYLGVHALKGLSRPEHVYQVSGPDSSEEFPPLESLELAPNNLPLPLTTFIGRESAINEIEKLLSTARLVTLTGGGGYGKTRLALETGRRLIPSFPDGVWFVELASLRDPNLIAQQVASVMGVREEPRSEKQNASADIEALLLAHTQHKRALVILDNAEHVVASCAKLTASLLESTTGLRILVTSREPLRVTGEVILQVPLLDVPSAGVELDLMQYESVRLFADRAVLKKSDWKLDDRNQSAVVQILRKVEGMPLAIELAAGLLSAFTPNQIAERLDEQFRLLAGGDTGPARHQTLTAVVDWSYELLSEDERELFRSLSVFSGGFSLTAAEGVCTAGNRSVLTTLAKLIDKSLVVTEEREGENRYSMHEIVRQFARARLADSDTAPSTKTRHLKWFLNLSEEAGRQMRRGNQVEWLDTLDLELDNLRSAFQWALAADDIDAAVRLAVSLRIFWSVRGHLSEGRNWLESAITACGSAASPLRVKAFAGAGLIARNQGDYNAARLYLSDALRLASEFEATTEIPQILANLGYISRYEGDYAEARGYFDQSLAIARERNDLQVIAVSLANLGLLLNEAGDAAGARTHLKESVAISRRLGDRWVLGFALHSLGLVDLAAGDPTTSADHLNGALNVARELGDLRGEASSLNALALLSRRRGDLQSAEQHAREALEISRRVADRRGIAASTAALGLAAFMSHDARTAVPLLCESVEIAVEAGDKPLLCQCLGDLAEMVAQAGDRSKAVRLLAAADSMSREILPGSKSELLQESRFRDLLGPEEFATQKGQGERMGLDQVLQEIGELERAV